MNSLTPHSWWRYRPPTWVNRFSTPHLLALTLGLIASIPLFMAGLTLALYWFLGYVIWQPQFWLLLLATFIWCIYNG